MGKGRNGWDGMGWPTVGVVWYGMVGVRVG